MFSRIFEAKNKSTIVLVLNLVEISKEFLSFIDLKITQTRFTLIKSPFVLLNKHFVRLHRVTHA